MSDLETILKKAKHQPIAARHPGKREKALSNEKRAKVIAEITLKLADRQWHKMCEIRKLANTHKSDLGHLLETIGAAESDDGRWVCIPGTSTPELSPDETCFQK